jgi:hypothetical protein
MENNKISAVDAGHTHVEPPPVLIERETFLRWLEMVKQAMPESNDDWRRMVDAMTYALMPPKDPARSGVGAWCAPGPADEQTRRFLLRFEDADRGDIVLTNEQQARDMFAKAEGRGWNCHLLAHLPRVTQTTPADK